MGIVTSWPVRRARPVRKRPTVGNNYERSFASIRGTNDIMSPALSAAAVSCVDRRDVTRLSSKSNEESRRAGRVAVGVGSLDKDRRLRRTCVANEPRARTHVYGR